jgi:glycosyltransferase involved in cell wall biosynthesis
VDRVLAISSVIRQNVLDTTPMSSDRVLLLFDAVDTSKFSPAAAREPGAVRRSLGVPEVGVLAGCVGRISPGKGHEELLEATRILKERRLGFTLLIAGEAGYGERDYEERIRSRTTELGLGQNVVFSGFRRDVPDLLHALDLFVFPSHAEAFGLALIEAMAMARPVVSTNTDGVLDIMVDGVTGLMVPPRDAASLAAGMERLLTDGPLRLRCGTAGRERVLERFDQRTQIDLLEGIYARVIAEARDSAAPSR